MDAVDLLARYAGTDGDQKLYAAGEKVPVGGVVPKAWLDGVVDDDGRVERIPYELCVLIALRDALRRREVYVQGAGRWKDPDEDLPGDFEDNRDVHYAALAKPLDATEFTGSLRKRLDHALTRLDTALATGAAGGVRIITRQGSPWVNVPKLDKLPEPRNLGALKAEVERRWGTIDLLDILKDTAFITGFTDSFTSVASREVLDRATLNRRLLLVLFALGTNMGIRQMAITGEHGVGEAELRHVRATYVTRENLRAAVTTVVNATLEARDPAWWGEATSTASDSKRFASWDSNLMTEFHARYGGYGVMIYWHVERGRLCVYSQLKSCSSSEVAAMIEGLLRHGTDVEIEANYTDTHGASLVGFAFTELLGFKLLPRLKNIGAIQLYAPGANQAGWPRLEKILKRRRFDWDLIARNYDQMVKYATALRLRTAETDQVLRRFTKAAAPSTRSTSPWRNSAGPCGPSSPATTSPTRSCAARSTPACRSWRTGTPPTTRSTTAARASSPATTASTPRSPCSRSTSCSRAWCTSTPSSSRRSCATRPGPAGSPRKTGGGFLRCSGRTSTPTGGSGSTWTPASTSLRHEPPCPGLSANALDQIVATGVTINPTGNGWVSPDLVPPGAAPL
jgi:hypothetical protein